VTDELRAARASLVNAISNIDILLDLVDAIPSYRAMHPRTVGQEHRDRPIQRVA
jgi:hypothetical protein